MYIKNKHRILTIETTDVLKNWAAYKSSSYENFIRHINLRNTHNSRNNISGSPLIDPPRGNILE